VIVMAPLDPEADAIVQAGRRALRATDSDRDRIEAALRARLGLNALPLAAVAKPAARSLAWRFGPAAAISACLVGGALFFTLRSHPRAVPVRTEVKLQQPPAAGIAAPAVAPKQSGAADAEPAVSSAALAPAAPSSSSPSREPDPLAQEVALLLRATSALSAGRAGEALKALNEHQRRFPNGILTEERRAAKAQAFCSLGRVAEGRAELAHLAPKTPAASRAKQVCDAISTPGEQR
jgi:hypothetical protein